MKSPWLRRKADRRQHVDRLVSRHHPRLASEMRTLLRLALPFAVGCVGFVWGVRHIGEAQGLFLTLVSCLIFYDVYRKLID